MKKLLFKKNSEFKAIISLYILFYIINFCSNQQMDEFKLEEIDKFYNKSYIELKKEQCILYTLELSEYDKSQNFYIHFSTFSNDNLQQIIYSSKEECPSTSNAEKYSYKYSKKSNLFINYPDNDKFYISLKCSEYPCSFDFSTKIEKEYAYLNIEDIDSYSYYVSGKEKINSMSFKIPSSLSKKYTNNEKHLLTISVANPSDIDYTQLYLKQGNDKKALNWNSFKFSMNLIFTVIEEDFIENFSENNFYVLEIESLANQFISISVKASKYDQDNNKLYSEITPNSSPKYSYFSSSKNQIKEECFELNEQYFKDNSLNEDDLFYASIEYYTNPINAYLRYNKEKQIPGDNFESQSSINLILERKSNEFPEICFDIDNKEAAFMLQVSHLSQNMNNIDIYNPLISGFIHTKTLKKNSLALYTHNSDIHYFDSISFYLKILKGNPEMYIIKCKDYPNCANTYKQLINDKNIIKPDLRENVYSYTKTNNDVDEKKDLSPYGVSQDLLYVYCPEKNNDDYCQFQVLIHSNLDEITLFQNDKFYSNLLKDESNLFKIHIPKSNIEIEKIKIILNTTEGEFELITDKNENIDVNIETLGNNQICEYTPYNDYSINSKDFDILFNIKANKILYYSIEYNIIKKNDDDTFNIYNLTFEKIKDINIINYLPIKIFSELPFKKNENKNFDFKELLFNLYFQSIDTNSYREINNFQIKATIINKKKLEELFTSKTDNNFFDESSLTKELDLSTKSVFLNIKKDFLDKFNNNDELVLYISINDINNNRKKYNLSGKLFLFYKNNAEFILPINNYINDNLNINDKNNYNLYHLQLEGELKYKFYVEFSSNYELNNKDLYISFLDYENINNVKEENLLKNSTNIKFIDSETKIGTIHHFEFTLNNKAKDVIMCVFSKLRPVKNSLSSVNYILKYNTYNPIEEQNRIQFELNKAINNKSEENITSFELEGIKVINEDNKIMYPKAEIYIRKISKKNKLKNEKLDTTAIIESEYELVNGNIIQKDGNIKINVPKIDENNEYYSVFINLPQYNEKFVYGTIFPKEVQNDKGNTSNGKKNIWLVIGISTAVLIIIIAVIAILMNCNKKNTNLKNNVMKTSFENSGVLDELNDL